MHVLENLARLGVMIRLLRILPFLSVSVLLAAPVLAKEKQSVTVDNFARAETDITIRDYAARGAFAQFSHLREPTPIDQQKVVRMNRDTLYSMAVIDLAAAPATITLPEANGRYMMMQVISQDHYVDRIVHGPASSTLTQDEVGTRYAIVLIRTFVDPDSKTDVAAVHALQDAITLEQATSGTLVLPDWDTAGLDKVRSALRELGRTVPDTRLMFGTREAVSPIHHLIGAAVGWGGNPYEEAVYLGRRVDDNSGKGAYRLTLPEMPVDGFWSVSVYNSQGYFEPNELHAYSLNSVTTLPDAAGTTTIRFGACDKDTKNCLPIMQGWNYTVRLYQPHTKVLNGEWKLPEAQPFVDE